MCRRLGCRACCARAGAVMPRVLSTALWLGPSCSHPRDPVHLGDCIASAVTETAQERGAELLSQTLVLALLWGTHRFSR